MKALIMNCSPVRTGATAEIVKLVSEQLSAKYSVRCICIDDYSYAFCRGCRSCHNTAKCVMRDAAVIESIMREFDEADIRGDHARRSVIAAFRASLAFCMVIPGMSSPLMRIPRPVLFWQAFMQKLPVRAILSSQPSSLII